MLPSVILPLLAGKVLLNRTFGPPSEAENRLCPLRSVSIAVPHRNAGGGCCASSYGSFRMSSAIGPNLDLMIAKINDFFLAHQDANASFT